MATPLPALTAVCLVAALAAPLPGATSSPAVLPVPERRRAVPPTGPARTVTETDGAVADLWDAHRSLRLRAPRRGGGPGLHTAAGSAAAALAPFAARSATSPLPATARRAPVGRPAMAIAVVPGRLDHLTRRKVDPEPATPPPAPGRAAPATAVGTTAATAPVAAMAPAPPAGPPPAPTPAAPATPSTDGTVPLDAAAADGLHRRAADALAMISYPWPHLGYEIVFAPGRPGVRARVVLHARRIEVFVRPTDSVRRIAFSLAHEIAHAFDFQRGTPPLRAAWQQARGIDADRPWFGCNACPDLATPAGDFAESFAAWQVPGGDFGSRLGPPPDDAQRGLLAELTAP